MGERGEKPYSCQFKNEASGEQSSFDRLIAISDFGGSARTTALKGEVQIKQMKRAKRFALAESSMASAAALAEYILKNRLGDDASVYPPMLVGICTVYCRVFLSSNGLGPVDKEFEEFDDPAHKETHEDLMRTRHEMCAHQDLTRTKALDPISGEVHDMHQVHLHVNGNNEFSTSTCQPTYLSHNLSAVIFLCKHQGKRFASEKTKAIQKLAGRKLWKPGDYELGQTFP